ADGSVGSCLHRFEPRPGDCVFLPAGTVHAVGGGVLLAEVQQTSDATFRLFDWNRCDAQGRTRPLHIEEGVAAINWNQGPVPPVRVPGFPQGRDSFRMDWVRCPYFVLDCVRESEPFALGGTGALQALLVVRGRGTLATPAGEAELARGQAWL